MCRYDRWKRLLERDQGAPQHPTFWRAIYASRLTTLDKPLFTYSLGSRHLAPRMGLPTACTLLSKIPATSRERASRSRTGGAGGGAGSSLMVYGADDRVCSASDAGRVVPMRALR